MSKFDYPASESTFASGLATNHAGHEEGGYGTGIPGTNTHGSPDGVLTGLTINADGELVATRSNGLPPIAVPLPPSGKSQLVALSGADDLPLTADKISALAIDIDGMTTERDLSGWIPTGLIDGAVVSVRKVDTSPHAIFVTDAQGLTYKFVDKRGEVISFVFIKQSNTMRVI